MAEPKKYKIAKSVKSTSTDRFQESVQSTSTDRFTNTSSGTNPSKKSTKKSN